jgi:alanyl-tRNA synthetase
MARAPSVSLDDVRGAIEVLKAQGVPDPGVHRIRALLGRGSVTTINAHKHRLRLDALERVLPGTRTRIPDPVTELAAQLWTQLNDQVDRVDAQREAEVNEALAQQKAAFADLQAAHAALQAETEQQAQQLATAQAQDRRADRRPRRGPSGPADRRACPGSTRGATAHPRPGTRQPEGNAYPAGQTCR